jgi:hypothetical protein
MTQLACYMNSIELIYTTLSYFGWVETMVILEKFLHCMMHMVYCKVGCVVLIDIVSTTIEFGLI